LFSCSQEQAAASSVTVTYRPRYEPFLHWISSEGVNYATQLFRYVELKTLAKRKRQPNPLKAVKIAFEKETGIILFSSALLDAGRFAVLQHCPYTCKRRTSSILFKSIAAISHTDLEV
jgi:hypothetical protein